MKLTIATLVLLAQFVAAGPPPAPPAPKPGTGLIVGRVIDGDSAQPVAGALVFVRTGRDEMEPGTKVFSGTDGHFVLTSVPEGRLALWAAKPGYVRTEQLSDAETMLTVREGERRGDVILRLWKLGAITGRVVDEHGDPAVGVVMCVARRMWVAGRPQMGDTFTSETDDRGIFRFARLSPGEYLAFTLPRQSSVPATLAADKEAIAEAGLWIEPPGSRYGLRVDAFVVSIQSLPPQVRADGLYVYPAQYYSNAGDPGTARAVEVKSGQESAGIDFTLRPQRSVRVSGRAVAPDGPLDGVAVHLVPAGSAAFAPDRGGPTYSTMTDAAGRFAFPGVVPGAYQARVLKGPSSAVEAGVILFESGGAGLVVTSEPADSSAADKRRTEPTLHAAANVTVGDRSVDDVVLQVRRGVRLTGRLEFTGEPPPGRAALEAAGIELRSADGRTFEIGLEGWTLPDRRFETVELPPGRYVIHASPPPDWHVDAVLQNGRNVSDLPIDVGETPLSGFSIRFAPTTTHLTGTVSRIEDNAPVLVAAFPVDRTRWSDHGERPRFLKSARPDAAGAFAIDGLPPGEYFVGAFREVPFTDWKSPVMLDLISRTATRVGIAANERKSMTLTVARVP